MRDAEDYLAALWHRLAGEGLRVRTVVLHTSPARAITFTARTEGADLIVMSTHGYSSVQRVLLGSVAEAVLRQTTTPVFCIRASEHPPALRVGPYRKVLVPLDGTSFAETALTYLQGADCFLPAKIVLLRAIVPDISLYGAEPSGSSVMVEPRQVQLIIDQEQAAAKHYLAQVRECYLEESTCMAPGSPHRQA